MGHRSDSNSDPEVRQPNIDQPGAASGADGAGDVASPDERPSDGPAPPADEETFSEEDSDDLGLRACAREFDDSFGLENERVVAAVVGRAPRLQEKIANRYVIYERVGRGGMGTVYAAYDPELDRKVAIKFLRASRRADVERTRKNLMWEAKSMARVEDRANVVQVYDVGVENGRTFLVMEFIGGTEGPATLSAWQQDASRSVDEILQAYWQAGRGLVAIHRAGLVHRDFKPANVFVTRDAGGRMRCVVGDLGLALGDPSPSARPDEVSDEAPSVPGRPYTASRALLGTLAYMAPEQLRRQKPDARSDQFSFCVALFEALYGARPFPAARQEETSLLAAIEAGVRMPRPPEKRRIPSRVERALRRGLSVLPEDRFSDMEELLAALAPVQRRLWPWLTVTAVAAAVALALAGNRGTDPCMAQVDAQMQELANVEEMLSEPATAAGGEVERALWTKLREEFGTLRSAWYDGHSEVCRQTQENPGNEVVLERNARSRGCLTRQRQSLKRVSYRLHAGDPFAPSLEELDYIDDLVAQGELDCLEPEIAHLFPQRPENHPAIDAVEEELAKIELELSRLHRAEWKEREKIARKALADAERIAIEGEPYGRPLAAAAAFRLGDILSYLGEHEEAEKFLARARIDAEQSHAEMLAAELWIYRIKYMLVERRGVKRAEAWLEAAESALLGVGAISAGDMERREAPILDDLPLLLRPGYLLLRAGYLEVRDIISDAATVTEMHLLRAGYLEVRGILASSLEQHEEAERLHDRALAMYKKLDEPSGDPALQQFRASKALNNRAQAAFKQRKWARARDHYRELLTLRTELLGDEHPLLANTLFALGEVERRMGNHASALEYFERARALAGKFDEELVRVRLRAVVGIIGVTGDMYYAQPEGPEAATFVQKARDAAAEIEAVHEQRRDTPFIDEFERYHEYTALASVAEMVYELGSRKGTAEVDDLERASKYFKTALGYFDKLEQPLSCTLQETRHRALYSAASIACSAKQIEDARELLTEALKPATMECPPERARRLREDIEKYMREHRLPAECQPQASLRMFDKRRNIHDGNRTDHPD
jgi:tetratricopeptide (TPR) repeat protein